MISLGDFTHRSALSARVLGLKHETLALGASFSQSGRRSMLDGNDAALDRFGTQRDVAEALEISQPAVAGWVKRGIIKPGKDGKIHVGTAVRAVLAARDPERALVGIEGGAASKGEGSDAVQAKLANDPHGLGPGQLLRARTVGATLAAQKQGIELKRLKGELISKVDVEDAIRTAQTVVIERLEGLPGLLASRVMAAPSVAAGEKIIREAISAVRYELARLGEGVSDA